ncbi:hypothetical protein TUM3792_29140 [Shewanella sp. MBTL60-007]|nr:hypothetical protein TUM3792_29140 [Shewanella sp. MBTL60-007]
MAISTPFDALKDALGAVWNCIEVLIDLKVATTTGKGAACADIQTDTEAIKIAMADSSVLVKDA